MLASHVGHPGLGPVMGIVCTFTKFSDWCFFYISGKGKHTLLTQIKRGNIDPYSYINLLAELIIYPLCYYHLRHTMGIAPFQMIHLH